MLPVNVHEPQLVRACLRVAAGDCELLCPGPADRREFGKLAADPLDLRCPIQSWHPVRSWPGTPPPPCSLIIWVSSGVSLDGPLRPLLRGRGT